MKLRKIEEEGNYILGKGEAKGKDLISVERKQYSDYPALVKTE
jgi:hypothetical protein